MPILTRNARALNTFSRLCCIDNLGAYPKAGECFMHIRVIRPVIDTTLTPAVTAEVEHWAAPGTTVDVVSLLSGTASIESEYDEALAGPGIVQRVEEAAADGVDGVFITCFADPGVHAAREIIDAPVVGGFEPSFLTAMSLGDRVGVVTILPNVVPMLRSLTRRYGLDNRLGSIRVVDMPVLGLTDREELIDRLAAQASAAVENGEADTVVLGCTGMLGVTSAVRDKLHGKGIHVPVVDPTASVITWLESSVRLGLTPSRTTYMTPPVKARKR